MTPEDFFRIHREICRRWQAVLGAKTQDAPKKFPSSCHALSLYCYIGGHPGCSLNEAAAFVGTSPGTASMLVDSLCGRKILTRTLHPGDRRRVCLFVTPAARCFLDEIEALINVGNV